MDIYLRQTQDEDTYQEMLQRMNLVAPSPRVVRLLEQISWSGEADLNRHTIILLRTHLFWVIIYNPLVRGMSCGSGCLGLGNLFIYPAIYVCMFICAHVGGPGNFYSFCHGDIARLSCVNPRVGRP